SPQTPGGYQVNVNRTKTRKWVQAPTQNYDGDDWGADEFEDDEPPPPPPVPRVTTGLRPVGQRTESFGPSPRLAAAVASSSRSSSNAPSLQLQTNHPDEAHPGHPEQTHNVSSPGAGRTGSPAPLSSGAGSSKAPSYHQQPDVRSSTPQSTASSAARASPSIRPDFRHIDDERKLGGSPLSIAENIAPRPDDRSTPPVNEPIRQGYGQGDGPAIDKVQKQPTFDSILAKRDSIGPGPQALYDPPSLDNDSASPEPSSHKEETVIHSPTDIDRKRLSVSPKLPDVTRMSAFGADFFSGNSSGAPASSQDPTKQDQPSALRQATDGPGNLSTLEEKPRESEDNIRTPGPNNSTSLAPANDPRAVPPLRTPSPNSKGLFPSPREPASATDSKITPTEPLNPRQPEYSPSNYEPNSALTQGSLNTFNSSPVKESDVLSEEIMKSLSPIAPTPNSAVSRPVPDNSQSLTPGDRGVARNSSYTLSDYDSYWADSNDKPEQESKEAEVQEKPKTETPVQEQQQQPTVQPLSSTTTTESQAAPPAAPKPESPKPDSRRRFSWEAGFDSPPKILPVEPPGAFDNEAPRPASPSPLAPAEVQSPKDGASNVASQSKESSRNVDTPKIIIPPSGGISHQVSKASTLPPSQQQATLEPPSPVSIENDDATPRAIDDRRPSVADKTLTQVPSNLTSASTPPEKSTKALPSSEFPQTTPWRDIMTLATPIQRTLKFESGLATHQAWESGLENWLSHLMTEHPEYANGTSSFSGAGVPTSQKGHASGPSLSHNQQPYYQQYLNASSPTTGPPTGRSRLGGSVPSGTSGFGNSSNQIGTKGKELMQSAGKMGKGLFSKGKSKLRGTGDKGEPTSPVQTKFKAERRASWGLDRLTRSRADDSSEKDVVNSRPSTQSYHAPQSSQSSSMLQFGSVPSTGEPGKKVASRESYGPQLSQDPSASASASVSISAPPSKANDDRTQWYIPTPIDESTWDPFKGTDLAKGKASEQSGAMPANQGQLQDVPNTQMPSSKPIFGNTASTPASGGIRMVPPEEPVGPSQPTYVYASVISQQPMANVPQPQTPTQTHDSSAMPQRHSSFVGLPPIRRGSTFDVNSRSIATEQRTTEPIAEHVSAEPEDLDEIARQQGTLTSEVTVGSTLVGTDSIMEEKYKKDVDGSEPQSPPSQKSPRHSLQQSPPRGPQHPFQMHPVQPGPMPSQSQGYQPPTLPLLPPQLMGGPVQKLPPSGPWKLEESHLSEPLHRVTPKPQAVPPSGQWKLEESHLAEPLHMVNRNRAGTNASQISQLSQRSQRSQKSQHDPFFGYNKETGDVPPSPSSGSTMPKHHQRQKPSEVPPSSANRYPGLFPGHQRQSSGSKEGHPGPGSQFIRRFSQEGITRTGTGDSAHEDRGRSKKASALLKDIGHRFRKSSTERRNTPVDHHGQQFHPPQQQQQLQPPHSQVPHDAASVSSVTTDGTHDKKKSRTSFMLGLRSKQSRERLSMPPPPRPDENRPATSTEERRGSRLHPDYDPVSGQHRPMGPPRAATSNLANEMSQSATPPAKKRFSAFNTKAAMTNVFNRPSSGTSSKPGTPTSSRPVSGHMGAQQPMSLERPAHPGFERSSTAGPSFNQNLPATTGTPPVDANERRKRRGSAAGLISGLLGHVHKSKESQQLTPPQMQQPVVQQPYDRRASGPRLDSPHPPALHSQGRRPSGSQLSSPVLPGSPLGSPHGSVPPLASPQPQRPHQLGQPAMSREQSPMSSGRPLSGGMRDNQHAHAAYRNSRPSPLGFGSTTPAGTPPIGSVIDHSRHGTPQTPFSVGQSFPDPRAARMRSISPAASAVRSAPTTQTSFNVPSTAPTTQPSFHHSSQSSQSLDKLAHSKHEGIQIQRPVTDSPNMSFRHDNRRPSHGAPDNDMPLSPVSQISNMGPPSVSSMATQSPRLNTASAAIGRRQSSQLSQPNTPIISAVSTTPPVQSFTNRMGMSPQQQQQQFPPGVQQQSASTQQQANPQQMSPQHGGYQITPGQQYEPNLPQPSGSQTMPGSYPQATSPGRPPMQMQHSNSGPPVPPKDGSAALQQPQVANQPARQGSPGASKWKGLRNRMSAQVSHKPAGSQGKNDNDKLTASKILGAFKRGSKENRQSIVIPDLQAYQNHEMRPVQRQQQQQAQRPQQPQVPQQPQQQFAGQVPPVQTQSPRSSSQVSGQPFGQVPTARPSSQSTGQPQTKRYSSMFSSPAIPQQEFRSPSGAFASSPQSVGQPQPGHSYQSPPQMQGQFPPTHSPQAQFHSPPQPHSQFQSHVQHQGHFQSPPQAQGQFTSPPMPPGQFRPPMQQQGHFQSPVQQQGQFQSPPQPQGQWQSQMHSPVGQFPPPQQRQASYPGQWHGTIGQSPNTPSSQRSPQHSQFSSQPQSPYGFPTGHNVPGEESPPVHVSTPTQVHSPTPVHAPSPRPSLLNLQAMVAANPEHDETHEGQAEHAQAAPRKDPIATHQGNSNMQRFKSDSPQSGGNPSPAQHTSPRTGTEQNGNSRAQAPTLPMPSIGGSSFMGSPVTTHVNAHFSPKAEESQGVSLSPPSGAPGSVSPNSTRQSPAGGSDLGPPEPKSRRGPSFHAELEDTEDARKRTLRIDSQEEKIHYDPNADSDGEVPPQMSATSYPGQEWNPYGMPEMGDWNEPMDHR
ncbi:hypothetical protein IL306_001233, partial [Fusarium sp. DS 682]